MARRDSRVLGAIPDESRGVGPLSPCARGREIQIVRREYLEIPGMLLTRSSSSERQVAHSFASTAVAACDATSRIRGGGRQRRRDAAAGDSPSRRSCRPPKGLLALFVVRPDAGSSDVVDILEAAAMGRSRAARVCARGDNSLTIPRPAPFRLVLECEHHRVIPYLAWTAGRRLALRTRVDGIDLHSYVKGA